MRGLGESAHVAAGDHDVVLLSGQVVERGGVEEEVRTEHDRLRLDAQLLLGLPEATVHCVLGHVICPAAERLVEDESDPGLRLLSGRGRDRHGQKSRSRNKG